ncbi:MAG: alpha/beta hydrolase [Rhodospirillales bacterium]|jgi:arylformamidase
MSDAHVYQNYTSAELQHQYDTRAGVPGIEEMVVKRPKMAAAYRAGSSNAKLNVAYGTREKETLDLFLPENASNAPVQLFIHGGYWTMMDKDDFSFVAKPYVDAGAIVAVANYDLCPTVSLPGIVEEMRRCLAWLYKNAASFGGNPDQLHISGHSAGGHLTGMMLATDWPAFDTAVPVDVIKSAVPMSGIYDLEAMRHIKLQELIALDEATARVNSPMFLDVKNVVPTLVAVGGGESDEFHRQSLHYVEHLKGAGADVTYMDCPGLYHSSLVTETLEANHPFTQARLRLMGLN